MSERRPAPEFFLALLTTVVWAAVSFAVAGLLAFFLDLEPVSQPVGPGYGFAALILAGAMVWLVSAFTARRPSPWIGMIIAPIGVYLLVCAVAFLVGFALLVEQATSPFVIISALLTPLGVVLCWAGAKLAPRSRE